MTAEPVVDVEPLVGLTLWWAERVAELRYEDLPPEVVEKAKLIVRDGLGNQVAASAISDSARRVVELMAEWGGSPEATVVGYGLRLPAPHAAMCNAMLGHGVELDDAHGAGLIKAGSVLIPSGFAQAELGGATGRELLTGLVAAYEVAIRVAKAINPGHRRRGYHTTGTVSLLGAAAMGAKLLGGDTERIAWAIGLAAMQSAGIQSYLDDPCMAKPFSPGKSAFNGVLASVLASRGLSGPRKVLESKEGFLNAFTDAVNVDELLSAFGERWAIMEVGFKPHAACRYAHGPLDIVQSMYCEEGARLADVEQVTVHMSELAIRQASKTPCPNLNVAMGSTEFGVSLGLALGGNGLEEYWRGFGMAEVHEAAAQRVTLRAEPEFGLAGRQAVVEVRLKDGRTLKRRQEEPKGEPTFPLSAAELERKFVATAGMVLEEPALRELGERALSLEAEARPADLVVLTRAGDGNPRLRRS